MREREEGRATSDGAIIVRGSRGKGRERTKGNGKDTTINLDK